VKAMLRDLYSAGRSLPCACVVGVDDRRSDSIVRPRYLFILSRVNWLY
jgi:hypothetical protein